MIVATIDTHVLTWFLFDDIRTSPAATALIKKARDVGDKIAISSLSFVEILYLVEKGRGDPSTLARSQELLEPDSLLVERPVDREIGAVMQTIPRKVVPDMPDRIIAATTVLLHVPLISRDRKIVASDVWTIW